MIADIFEFAGALALTVVSSLVLIEVVERIGHRFRLSDSLVGILAALTADSPEISAAITAIHQGRARLGFGVVIGSNIFNVAMLLGLSAVVAGTVRVRRRAVLFAGGVASSLTAVVSALVFGVLAPIPAVLIALAVFSPYVAISALRPEQIDGLVPLASMRRFLTAALSSVEKDVRPEREPPKASRHDLYTLVPALAAVVLGSVVMVDSSVALGDRWGISQVVMGTVVLAALTGLPNVLAAIRLALHRRGSVVVSEALNSNSINLLVGIAMPTLIVGVAPISRATELSVWWLGGITAVTLVFTAYRGGLRRSEGLVVLAAYVAFLIALVTI